MRDLARVLGAEHELEAALAAPTLAGVGVEPGAAGTIEEIAASFWAADLWRRADGAGPDAWLRRAGSHARCSSSSRSPTRAG